MKMIKQQMISLLLVVAMAAALFPAAAMAAVPQLNFSTDTMDFGTLGEGYLETDLPSEKTLTITILNPGETNDVKLALEKSADLDSYYDITMSGFYFLPESDSYELQPGQATVTIRPKADLSPGTYNGVLAFQDMQGQTNTLWLNFAVTEQICL